MLGHNEISARPAADITKPQLAQVGAQLGAGLAALTAARVALMPGFAPFGVAMAGALAGKYGAAATLGAAIGYFFSPDPGQTLRSIAALLLLAALRWVAGALLEAEQLERQTPLYVGFSVLLTAIGAALDGGVLVSELLLAFAEALLAGGGAYFFARGLVGLTRGFADENDAASAVIGLAVLVAGAAPLRIAGISPGLAACAFFVLVAARLGGVGGGAVGGIAVGAAAALSGGSGLLWGCSLGGLAAGVFHKSSPVWMAGAYVLIGQIAAGLTRGDLSGLWEGFCGAAVFLLMPERWFQLLQRAAPLAGVRQRQLGMLYALRLRRADLAMREMATLTKRLSESLQREHGEKREQSLCGVAETLCGDCGERERCWVKSYGETSETFLRAFTLCEQGERPPPALLAPLSCPRAERLAALLEERSRQCRRERAASRRLSGVEGVVTDQFGGLSLLLGGIRREVQEITDFEEELTERLCNRLHALSLSPELAVAYRGGDGRLTLELLLPGHARALAEDRLPLALCELCEQALSRERMESVDGKLLLVYKSTPRLTAEFAIGQRSAEPGRDCGDSAEAFFDGEGRLRVLLSDGMGVGGAAAVDSMITLGLLMRLLRGGVAQEAALRMVNAALVVRGGEESLATVDCAELDLASGRLRVAKAGAAPSFLLRGELPHTLRAGTLPLGILSGLEFEERSLPVGAGDVLLFVSDGVLAGGEGWVLPKLRELRACPCREIAQGILAAADEHATSERPDDRTAIVVKLAKAQGE